MCVCPCCSHVREHTRTCHSSTGRNKAGLGPCGICVTTFSTPCSPVCLLRSPGGSGTGLGTEAFNKMVNESTWNQRHSFYCDILGTGFWGGVLKASNHFFFRPQGVPGVFIEDLCGAACTSRLCLHLCKTDWVAVCLCQSKHAHVQSRENSQAVHPLDTNCVCHYCHSLGYRNKAPLPSSASQERMSVIIFALPAWGSRPGPKFPHLSVSTCPAALGRDPRT